MSQAHATASRSDHEEDSISLSPLAWRERREEPTQLNTPEETGALHPRAQARPLPLFGPAGSG